MSDAATALLQQAMTLTDDDRRWLADQLDATLGPPESQLPHDPAFRAELDRRLQSIADGTAVLLDGEQVMRELRARYARGRQP